VTAIIVKLAARASSRRPTTVACACATALATVAMLFLLALAPGASASAQSGDPAGASAEPSPVAGASSSGNGARGLAAATLQQCLSADEQAERSATFGGEMTAVPGTVRMAMRIDLQERLPMEPAYHAVPAQGAGQWRSSDAKVKVFKFLRQVTDLSAPARYRGSVRFRWIGAHGVTLRRTVRVTRTCWQPAPAPTTAPLPGA
jgi:hypothetical protein